MKKINVFLLLAMLFCGLSGVKATTVYYDNANGWSSVYCYVYSGSTNNSWPGTAMTQTTINGKTWYKFDVPDNLKAGQFIVNDNGGNQYPASMQPGIDLNSKDNVWLAGTSVSYTDGSASDGGSTTEVYTPTVTDGEISCFLETSNDGAKIWVWNDTYNFSMDKADARNDWNNKPSMTLMGKSSTGKNIFKWTYTGTQTARPTKVIFTDASGNKKLKGDTDIDFKNHGYYVDGDYSKTITAGGTGGDDTKIMISYDNSTTNWSKVYCYIYLDKTAAVEWPGIEMTADGNTYTCEVPDAFKLGYYVINNGEGAVTMNGKTIYQEGTEVHEIETTNISKVQNDIFDDDAWYTLSGVKISRPTQPGIYIHKGKKYIVRK